MFRNRLVALVVLVSMVVALVPFSRTAEALSTSVVISQVYGGGGNSGAQFTNDFIELFNRGGASIDLSGWSVQYTSATGPGNFGSAANLITPLTGTIAPGQYVLIQEAAGTTPVAALPAPDVTDATPINMRAARGKAEPVDVSSPWYTIGCTTSGSHAAAQTGGPTTFRLDPTVDFAFSESCTVTVLAAQVTDQDTVDPPNNMLGNFAFSFTTEAPPPPPTFIHEIQGVAHVSPLFGQTFGNVPGIVTAKRTNGFNLQDPSPDSDPATSEGIFVFTGSAPASISVGDAVRVKATVSEFRPGGASGLSNLSTTELVSPTVTVLSHGNPPPVATLIGLGGRMPPTSVIEDDAIDGNVETSGVFDPASDGLDFYESLEGMLVQINDPVIVGPSNSFNEIPVLPDDGSWAGPRTAHGGILYSYDDGNPERIIV